ncbi:MAG: hypothetical protein V2I35_05425 [Desulfocapsaceae bacterium]|jgi:hypothetical protein|nr:hypothetical protein [Desulfocapsaceae bacterium]
MKRVLKILMVAAAFLLIIASTGHSAEDEAFTAEKMIADLNDKIELSKEQWDKLKPVLGEKSDELKKSISEYLDTGHFQMEEMSRQLKGFSEDTEQKLKTFLNSEEVRKLKNYLDELDEDAIRKVRDKMVAELSEILVLTEEQLDKLKPLLEESMSRMSALTEGLAERGSSGWEEFKKEYKALTDDLRKKLQETLDNQQMERFDQYKQDKQEKIERAFV